MPGLLPLAEAQKRLLDLAPSPRTETVALEAAIGRYLARDLIASRTQPSADLSAMDGYAISGAGPWQKVGESRAGKPFSGAISAGQCTRISTGAHMPDGSDRVLIQENASVEGDLVRATELPPPDRHVRKRGFDFSSGELIVRSGTRLGPAHLALALSSGNASANVAIPPKIVVMDSGDELVSDPRNCADHQIPASNGPMIAAMLQPLVGSAVNRIGPVRDKREDLASALEQVDQSDADILITSGGASVGDHDLIKPALIAWGADLAFWKVAMKPGKPLMVATRERERGRQVILGLPGNPVSSFVTCFLFALPLVRQWLGAQSPLPQKITTRVGEDLPAIGQRQEFLRAIHSAEQVVTASSQDSSALAALAGANCLIDRPSGAGKATKGDTVSIYPLTSG